MSCKPCSSRSSIVLMSFVNSPMTSLLDLKPMERRALGFVPRAFAAAAATVGSPPPDRRLRRARRPLPVAGGTAAPSGRFVLLRGDQDGQHLAMDGHGDIPGG